MISAYCVFGLGRVGRALAASLKHARLPLLTWRGRGDVALAAALAGLERPQAAFLCMPEYAVLQHLPLLRRHALPYVIVSGSLEPRELGLGRVHTLHPLMGFSARGPKSLRKVPVGVDSAELQGLAVQLGALPFMLPRDRTLYHAAAVLAGAGVLAAWREAVTLLARSGVRDAEAVLQPIALAALKRNALTGPVVRGDNKTIRAHRHAIADKDILRVYDALIAAMRTMPEAKK